MKKCKLMSMVFVTFVFCFVSTGAFATDAEWITNGSNIYSANSGNVGIGTNEPFGSSKLDVRGTLSVTGATWYPTVILGVGGADGIQGYILTYRSGVPVNYISAISGDNTYFNNGNVGIGTTTPAATAKLHVASGKGSETTGYTGFVVGNMNTNPETERGAGFGFYAINAATGGSDEDSIYFGHRNNAGTGEGTCSIISSYKTAGADTSDLRFYCTWAEAMRITGAGNVGIGTTTPEKKLEVVGSILLSTDRADRGIYWSNTGGYGKIERNNSNGNLIIQSQYIANENLLLQPLSGNVGIGTTSPQSKLAVNGTITAKEVKVTTSGWSDFVFDEGYKLPPISEVETYIKTNKHLPDVPSAKEIKKDGLAMSEMMAKQMQKIEELTLYVIELKKENQELKTKSAQEIAELKSSIATIKGEK